MLFKKICSVSCLYARTWSIDLMVLFQANDVLLQGMFASVLDGIDCTNCDLHIGFFLIGGS